MFTCSGGTKQLSDSFEDEDVSAAAGQAIGVQEADDEGWNERSNTGTCQTEGDREGREADVAVGLGQ